MKDMMDEFNNSFLENFASDIDSEAASQNALETSPCNYNSKTLVGSEA